MLKIVGVVFNCKGRIYNFDANELELKCDDQVIVETEKGLQYGFVTRDIRVIENDAYDMPLKKVLRLANKKDCDIYKKNCDDAKKALEKAKEIANNLSIDMHFLDASFTFDRKQLLFNFIADERVDFRELAKKLASIYKTRIELRQIGVRDKAKEIGGLGPCGRLLCCKSFLSDINGVTINMAKNQMLALNPNKINGSCGRLLCCLSYEDDVYLEYRKKLPEIGSYYNNKSIRGKIINEDILRQKIYVEVSENNVVEVSLDGNDK